MLWRTSSSRAITTVLVPLTAGGRLACALLRRSIVTCYVSGHPLSNLADYTTFLLHHPKMSVGRLQNERRRTRNTNGRPHQANRADRLRGGQRVPPLCVLRPSAVHGPSDLRNDAHRARNATPPGKDHQRATVPEALGSTFTRTSLTPRTFRLGEYLLGPYATISPLQHALLEDAGPLIDVLSDLAMDARTEYQESLRLAAAVDVAGVGDPSAALDRRVDEYAARLSNRFTTA